MKSLFVMDPLERLHLDGDSTYMMMLECTRRGHEVWWCTPKDLSVVQTDQVVAQAQRVETFDGPKRFVRGEISDLFLEDVDAVWMRKDPPFDMSYIFTCYLLDLVPRSTVVVNDPRGVMRFNEKLWALRFAEHHPHTVLSRDLVRLRAFIRSEPGRVVLKPWDGNGGRGVLVTSKEDRNLNSMLELLTQDGTQYVLCQRYVEAAAKGDKRILLIDGEPVGAMTRVPPDNDHRGNMHVGATVVKTELSPADQAVCAALRQPLKDAGMTFVGIDMLGDLLTEINVTSPTGIQEINALYDVHLERDLVDAVQRLVQERAS